MATSLYDLSDPNFPTSPNDPPYTQDLAFSDENEKDDLDSLPSISTDEIYSDTESDAQEEWERSLEQVQQLLTLLIVPWVGKYFGRKFAYWSEFPTPILWCKS